MSMTEHEAIRELHNIRPRGAIIPQKRAEALDMALKALEKQIPKKMEFIPKKFPCDYKCPNGCKQYDEYKINYCPNCGQKLDWGNE